MQHDEGTVEMVFVQLGSFSGLPSQQFREHIEDGVDFDRRKLIAFLVEDRDELLEQPQKEQLSLLEIILQQIRYQSRDLGCHLAFPVVLQLQNLSNQGQNLHLHADPFDRGIVIEERNIDKAFIQERMHVLEGHALETDGAEVDAVED